VDINSIDAVLGEVRQPLGICGSRKERKLT